MNTLAQSTPNLILPKEPDNFIQWNVSAFSSGKRANLGYDELAVFVTNAAGEKGPSPIQGRFTYKANYLIFTPYYPFEKGLTYTVRTKHLDTDVYSYHTFVLETSEKHYAAELLSIYPSADVLPENLLRLYFYFSTPMKKGEVLKHIQLVDSKGNTDTHVFMQFKQELWSPDGKRLTLLFDPGRIKRGVSTNLELGPALQEGNTYQLVISGEWQDVYGQPLSEKPTKTFSVKDAYRQSINIDEWVIDKPKAKSYNPLTIHFDRIMDYALLQSMIRIQDEEKNEITGHWETLEQEQSIQFIPEKEWQKGNYHIVFDRRLEDAAGNNLQGLLDEKITDNKKDKKASVLTFNLF